MYLIKYRDKTELKDSKIQWLGYIPKTWDITKAKYFYRFGMGQTILKEDLQDIGIPVFSATEEDVYFGKIVSPRIKLYNGDIVIPARGNSIGAVKMAFEDCTCTQTTIYGKKISNSNKRYDYYYFKGLRKHLFYFDQTAIPQITTSQVANNCLLKFNEIEKSKISNFLDIKTTQFNNIIIKKEQLIKQLEEAKKSLISEVVTGKVKITDGKLVPRDANDMRDIGITEFGLIASDYRVSKIKFYGDFKAGISKSADYFGKGYPFVNYPDVYKNKEIASGSGLALISKKEKIDFSIKKGDVFFTRTSETIDDIGESCICKSDIIGGSYSGFIIRFRLRDKNEIVYDYLKYFFQNSNIKKWFARQLNIVTRASLSQDKLKELPLILPSYDEQKTIGKYLNSKIAQLDSSVAKTSLQIEKLKQAKQALISEAVTGKIDLRDWEIIEEGELQ